MFVDSENTLRDRGEATVNLGGRPFLMKQQFLDDLEKQDLPSSIGALRKALLIMHAPLDDVVEIDNASALFMAAKHPKSFVSLDTSDHLLSREVRFEVCGSCAGDLGLKIPASLNGPRNAVGL